MATTTPAHATTPCAIQPYGLIGDYWRSMGAENSWFGCATGVEYSVPNMATGRKQRFENGQIAWSPDQGPKMIVAAFNKNGVAVFRWWPTNPFNYDYFVCFGPRTHPSHAQCRAGVFAAIPVFWARPATLLTGMSAAGSPRPHSNTRSTPSK